MISFSVNIKESEKSYPVNIEWDEISTMRNKILSHINGTKASLQMAVLV